MNNQQPTAPHRKPCLLLSLMRRLHFPHKLGILERFFKNHLAPFGKCWITTAYGINWLLDLKNPTHRWIVYGDYEGPHLKN